MTVDIDYGEKVGFYEKYPKLLHPISQYNLIIIYCAPYIKTVKLPVNSHTIRKCIFMNNSSHYLITTSALHEEKNSSCS